MSGRFGSIEGSSARRSWWGHNNLRLRGVRSTYKCYGNKRRNARGTRSPYCRFNAAIGYKLRVRGAGASAGAKLCYCLAHDSVTGASLLA